MMPINRVETAPSSPSAIAVENAPAAAVEQALTHLKSLKTPEDMPLALNGVQQVRDRWHGLDEKERKRYHGRLYKAVTKYLSHCYPELWPRGELNFQPRVRASTQAALYESKKRAREQEFSQNILKKVPAAAPLLKPSITKATKPKPSNKQATAVKKTTPAKMPPDIVVLTQKQRIEIIEQVLRQLKSFNQREDMPTAIGAMQLAEQCRSGVDKRKQYYGRLHWAAVHYVKRCYPHLWPRGELKYLPRTPARTPAAQERRVERASEREFLENVSEVCPDVKKLIKPRAWNEHVIPGPQEEPAERQTTPPEQAADRPQAARSLEIHATSRHSPPMRRAHSLPVACAPEPAAYGLNWPFATSAPADNPVGADLPPMPLDEELAARLWWDGQALHLR